MARWRAEALKRFPELHRTIASSDSIMALWIDLTSAFEKAYKADPPDEPLIVRIYAFADWCLQAPRGPDAGRDPLTAVTVPFHEHIPAIPQARQDMPRWFRHSEILQGRDVFSYLIGDRSYQELLAHMRRNKHLYRDRSHPPVQKDI